MEKGKGVQSEAYDFDDDVINIEIIHGGTFTSDNCYIGGSSHLVKSVGWTSFLFEDLEDAMKSLGYNSIRKSALRNMRCTENYAFFEDTNTLDFIISDFVDKKSATLHIYVQCLDHYMSNDDTNGIEKGKRTGNDEVDDTGRVNLLGMSYDEVESEYESSDGSVYSLESSEDENGYRRSKKSSSTLVYKKTLDKKSLVFQVGLQFYDYAECKETIIDWDIENGYNIRWKRSDEKKIDARCDEDCSWMLYASKLGHESTFAIKTVVDKHTCLRKPHNRQATSDWFASKLMPILKRHSHYLVKDMIQDAQEKWGIVLQEKLCYKAKSKSLKQMRGSFESHYAQLKPYIGHMQEMDTEGRFLLQTTLNNNVLGGTLLAAVAKDNNNKMWPIAWAVVEKETEDSWTWFFGYLFADLNIVDGLGWTFMSDKHRGIINGIIRLTPNAEHRHCARHIYANWKKKISGRKLKKLFWEAVKCISVRV